MTTAQSMHEMREQLTQVLNANGFDLSSFYYSHDGSEDTLSLLCYRKGSQGQPVPDDAGAALLGALSDY